MKYEKIGQVFFDVENKIIGRKPTKSNILETSGSDNDIYLCNITQIEVIEKIKTIMEIEDPITFNGTKITMNFYGTDVEFYFNINPQGRVSYRIIGKNRLYGMVKHVGEVFNITLDVENIVIFFDFNKYAVFFENYDKIYTIY